MSDEPTLPFGAICHHEIPAPDLDRQQAFYGAVFGWQFTPMGPTYLLFGDGLTGGGLDASMPVADGGCIPVMAVPEVTAKLAEIRAAGGTPLTEKTEIGGGHGYYAYFRDPCGNKMGIWSRT